MGKPHAQEKSQKEFLASLKTDAGNRRKERLVVERQKNLNAKWDRRVKRGCGSPNRKLPKISLNPCGGAS